MTNSEVSENALEAQLEMLRSVNTSDSAKRVQRGIKDQAGQHRRHVAFASLGAAVAAIATIHFVMQGEAFGYIALSFTTIVMAFAAWRSANQARNLATVKSGASMLASWKEELQTQLKHTLIAPFITLAFAAMTGRVIALHGTTSFKGVTFLTLTAALLVFAVYQLLAVRPQLQRELELFNQDD